MWHPETRSLTPSASPQQLQLIQIRGSTEHRSPQNLQNPGADPCALSGRDRSLSTPQPSRGGALLRHMKFEEIAEAIARLPPDQLARFRRWFTAFEARRADNAEELEERDFRNGQARQFERVPSTSERPQLRTYHCPALTEAVGRRPLEDLTAHRFKLRAKRQIHSLPFP